MQWLGSKGISKRGMDSKLLVPAMTRDHPPSTVKLADWAGTQNPIPCAVMNRWFNATPLTSTSNGWSTTSGKPMQIDQHDLIDVRPKTEPSYQSSALSVAT